MLRVRRNSNLEGMSSSRKDIYQTGPWCSRVPLISDEIDLQAEVLIPTVAFKCGSESIDISISNSAQITQINFKLNCGAIPTHRLLRMRRTHRAQRVILTFVTLDLSVLTTNLHSRLPFSFLFDFSSLCYSHSTAKSIHPEA